MKKKKTNAGLFITAFIVILVIMVISNIVRQDINILSVPNNPGVSGLETAGDTLVCTFQDGRIVTWAWDSFQQAGDFKAVSDRVIVLDSQHAAAVNTSGKKILTVYSLPSGQKENDLSVGWEDQDVWLRISSNKTIVALIRQNPPDTQGNVLFEFLIVDITKKFIGSPATLSILQDARFVEYAVDNDNRLIAVGSKKDVGCIVALNLDKGTVLWDTVYPDTQEFCSIISTPNGNALYAGSRDGILYKLDSQNGWIVKKIQLLEKGETRSVTNDYSVLNLAFSPDGQYYVVTINPKAYILESDTDNIIHIETPADRLVSRIAFSPDNKSFATSDIRADYPIKIWSMPQEK